MRRKTWYVIGAAIVLLIVAAVSVWLNINKFYDDNNPLCRIGTTAGIVMKFNGVDNCRAAMSDADYARDVHLALHTARIDSTLLHLDRIAACAGMHEPAIGSRDLYITLHPDSLGKLSVMLAAIPLNNYVETVDVMSALRKSVYLHAADTASATCSAVVLTVGDGTRYYVATADGCLFAADSFELLDLTINNPDGASLHDDARFSTLERTTSNTAHVSIYLNLNALGYADMADWVELDVDLSKKCIVGNGFATSNTTSWLMALSGNPSCRFSIDAHIPTAASTFTAYAASPRGLANEAFVRNIDSVDTIGTYRSRQEAALKKYGTDIEAQMSRLFAHEMAMFSLEESGRGGRCLVLKADNGTIAQALLNSIVATLHKTETPAQVGTLAPVPNINVPVYEAFNANDEMFFLSRMFAQPIPRKYYIRYENTLFLSDDIPTLNRTLYEVLLSRTYGNDADFRNFRLRFPDDYVNFVFENSNLLKNRLIAGDGNEASVECMRACDNFYGMGAQVSTLSGLPYVTLGTSYEPSRLDMVPTAWQSRLDTTILGRPFAVVNHNTQETEFLVQDNAYTLYLINPRGLILWKRKLDGPILGDVTQIDYYTNRKLQYLFSTPDNIHLIDRNGNNTADFPIRLSQQAVSGVTYIDYGNPREFRLFVGCADKTVSLYDRTGHRIQGWEMQRTEGEMRRQVDHWVSNNKDYLIMADDYRCYITDRRGNERVPLKPMAPNRDSRVYVANANTTKAAFVTSTADAKFATIDIATGRITLHDVDGMEQQPHTLLKLKQSGRFAMVSSRHIAVLDSDGNVISNEPISLSSATWSTVTADGNIAVWDGDENLGYIFSPSAKMVSGFPIPACGPFAMTRQNNVMHIVAAGADGVLNCYLK